MIICIQSVRELYCKSRPMSDAYIYIYLLAIGGNLGPLISPTGNQLKEGGWNEMRLIEAQLHREITVWKRFIATSLPSKHALLHPQRLRQ